MEADMIQTRKPLHSHAKRAKAGLFMTIWVARRDTWKISIKASMIQNRKPFHGYLGGLKRHMED